MGTKEMNDALNGRAKSGKPKAQFARARRLWIPGRRASKQKKLEAMKWYRTAAELGHPQAQVALGEIQLESDLPFYDPSAGFDWIRRAAEQGHVNAQRFLGRELAVGEIVERDPKRAAYWYRKAALSGHADAQYNLGIMYWEGDGVPKNAATARKWIAKAER